MKIFWSWQSDTPQNAGRHFVRAVIADLARSLNGALDIITSAVSAAAVSVLD